MESLWRDCKLAWRRFRAAPGVAVFSIVTLALGIGVATGTYSVVYTGLWRPLGLGDESRVIIISRTNMFHPGPTQMSWVDFQHLAREQHSLSSLAAWSWVGTVLAGEGTAELADVELVSGDYFKAVGVNATRGRTIEKDDDRPEARPVVVLSDSTWRDQFNGDRAIVGKTIKIADRAFEVIGVAPPGFRGVNPHAFVTKAAWVPLAFAPQLEPFYRGLLDPGSTRQWLFAVGRVKPDQTLEQSKADVSAMGERLDTTTPLPPYKGTPTAVPLAMSRNWTTGLVRDAEQLSADSNEIGRLIVVLPGLVLLIACTNLANLVLSRGASRRHDFAVRRALGASRWRLIREQLVEQGAIALLGGAAGLVVANALVHFTANIARETMAPFIRSARIDWTLDAGVLQATAVAVLLSLVVSGLFPALHLTRDSLRGMLDQGSAHTTPKWRGRGNLIALQVGVSVGLFLIAVIFIRIMLTDLPRPEVAALPPGLDRLAVASVPFRQQGRDETRTRETLRHLFEDAQLASTTDAVAVTSSLPFRFLQMGGSGAIEVSSTDRPFTLARAAGIVSSIIASPKIFTILDRPIRFGRAFDDRDTKDAKPVVVVNEGLALDIFGVADVSDRELLMRAPRYSTRGEESPIERVTIVGVVAGGNLQRNSRTHDATVYLPFGQRFEPNLAIVARSPAGTVASVADLRDAIKRADPELAVEFLARGDVLAVGPLAFTPYLAALLTLLALLALVLAMAGLYGVLSHVVARRTREMGIRIALGAEPGRITRLVLKDGFRPIVEGLFIGLATATIVRVFMKLNLYMTIAPVDPLAFCLAIVLLVIAGSAACYLPARRASRVDPNVALRSL